jgi:hypothetical protein
MGNEASEAGRALANKKWAGMTKAERLKIGRKLTDDRLAKQKKRTRKKSR